MKTKLTVVDIMCAQLLGEQFMYGSSIHTIVEVLLTESGLTVDRRNVDMIVQTYSK